MCHPQRPSITGRPVMITGAASGIGRALAQRLSGLGSPVAIADIDEAGLKETAAALPGPVLTRVLDVADAADQVRFAAEVREWLPAPLAAVFNNAGVARDLQRAGRGARGRRLAARHQLPRRGQRHPRVPADPRRAGRRRHREHVQRVRAGRHAVPERLLRGEVRGARLHRLAAPGTARHRRARGRPCTRAASRRTSPATPASASDPEGRGRTKEQMAAQFEAITMTSPEKAAADHPPAAWTGARPASWSARTRTCSTRSTRITPTHYYTCSRGCEQRLRARPGRTAS